MPIPQAWLEAKIKEFCLGIVDRNAASKRKNGIAGEPNESRLSCRQVSVKQGRQYEEAVKAFEPSGPVWAPQTPDQRPRFPFSPGSSSAVLFLTHPLERKEQVGRAQAQQPRQRHI